LPHIYALSVNSPFWVGQDTGLKGYRLKGFERSRTGIPDAFESLSEYEDFCKRWSRQGASIIKKIWWDIRLHPFSIRLRCGCAMPNRAWRHARDCALIQAVIAKLYKLLKHNTTFRVYRRRLLDENRWRASRYGIEGKLIDFRPGKGGRDAESAQPSSWNSVRPKSTNSRANARWRNRTDHAGSTGADRQLEVFHRTNDMKAVVDQIVAETTKG